MKFIYENHEKKEFIITYKDNGLNVLDFWMSEQNTINNFDLKKLLNLEEYQILISHDKNILFENKIEDRYLIRLHYSAKELYNSRVNIIKDINVIPLTNKYNYKFTKYLEGNEELSSYKEKFQNKNYYTFLLLDRNRNIIGTVIFKEFSSVLLLEYYYLDKEYRGKKLGVYLITTSLSLFDKIDVMANVESTNLASFYTLINSGFNVFNRKSFISFR